eukprot:augustus_masked-scaffold_5-processed-gene-8.28-mRNA-1 protein AED:1.00 eAED:1.00 QI:0/-1/0/0/-1/1/1/0/431
MDLPVDEQELGLLASSAHVKKKKIRTKGKGGKHKTKNRKTQRTRRHKKKGSKKFRTLEKQRKAREKEEEDIRNQLKQNHEESQISSSGSEEKPAMTFKELEEKVLKARVDLTLFYKKHKPENVNDEVLAVLLQYFVDSGEDKLNYKLKTKYGEDLTDFFTKPAINLGDSHLTMDLRASLNNAMRKSLTESMQREGFGSLSDEETYVRPDQKVETSFEPGRQSGDLRASMSSTVAEGFGRTTRKKKKKKLDVVEQYKKEKEEEKEKANKRVEDDLHMAFFGDDNMSTFTEEIPEHMRVTFELLDRDYGQPVPNEAYIEAFYSQVEPTKFFDEESYEKILKFCNKKGREALNKKLMAKYQYDLYSFKEEARRRHHARLFINKFYMTYDKAMLKPEKSATVLQIVNKTMNQGIDAVNEAAQKIYSDCESIFPQP